MSQDEPDFRYWWTLQEWSRDKRTGAIAKIAEQASGAWKWNVQSEGGTNRQDGISSTQKGARAACRRAVNKLPNRTT